MKDKIPEINLKIETTQIKATTRKLKTAYRIVYSKSGSQIITSNLFVYIFYKIWWKIKPPQLKIYYTEGLEKELEEAIKKEIDK